VPFCDFKYISLGLGYEGFAMKSICAAIVFTVTCTGVFAGEMNTRDRLEELGKGLAEAWEKYNTEAQKATRQQTISDRNTVFNREVSTASVPPNQKIAQVVAAYRTNLEKANDYFRTEKMKSERGLYVKACTLVLKREIKLASDFAAARTTQDVFNIYVNELEEACDTFVVERNKDLRQEAMTGMQQLFTDLLKDAKVPENVDHADQMDKNIKEGKKRFPTTTKVLQAKNQAALTAVESAAKQLKQKSVKR
jgi:hypothetical protein